SPEGFGCLYWCARLVAQPPGHDQRVAGVLVQELVRLDVEGVGERVPHNLVDADDCAGRIATVIQRAAETDEEHRVARDGADVNDAVEGEGQPRLKVESIEGIEDRQVLAVRAARLAVGEWEVDP